MSEQENKPPKKRYSPPRLVTYGDIGELTRASSTDKQRADGGAKLKTKTA